MVKMEKTMYLAMMIVSEFYFIFLYFDTLYFHLKLVLAFFSFDLQLEKWGIDVEILKEPAIMQQFIGWMKD